MGFMVQHCKCSIWSPYDLLPNLFPFANWTISRFWASLLDFFPSFFLFYKTCWMKCSLCKCTFKVKGCPSGFWDSLLLFYAKTFLFIPFVPSFTNLSTLIHFLKMWFSRQFLGTYLPQTFWITHRPPWCIIKFLSSFIMQFHFHRAHCTNGLFGELGTFCTYYRC